MADHSYQAYLLLNYNQDSNTSDTFDPAVTPDWRGQVSIVRYVPQDDVDPRLNADRLFLAVLPDDSDTLRWSSLLSDYGVQQITGTLLLYPRTDSAAYDTTPFVIYDYDGSKLLEVKSTEPGAVYPAIIPVENQPYVRITPTLMLSATNDQANPFVRLRSSDGTVYASGAGTFGSLAVGSNFSVTSGGASMVLLATSATQQSLVIPPGSVDPTVPISGLLWNTSDVLKFRAGFTSRHVALADTADTLVSVVGISLPYEASALYRDIAITRPPSGTLGGTALRISAGNARGTNINGGDLLLRSGLGTGNASSPTIYLDTAVPTGSGTTLQTHDTRMSINATQATFAVPISVATLNATTINVDTGSGTRTPTLNGAVDNATTVTGTTTATQIHGTGSTYFKVGQNLRISVWGTMSTTAGNSPNLTFTVRQGASTVLGTVVVTTGAGMSASGNRFWLEADIAIQSATSTTCMMACRYIADGNVSNNISGHRMTVDTATTVTNVTTTANPFRVYAQWASTAGTCTVYGSSSVIVS